MTTISPVLSVIIPTIGRPSLASSIKSFDGQLGLLDEVIVISDGPNPDIRCLVESAGGRYSYLETPVRMYDWGATPRNIGMTQAHGEYLIFMDDDDTYLPGALATIRRGVIESPRTPIVFRMKHRGRIIWEKPELKPGNVSSQMFAIPNIKGLVGHWTSRYAGDFDFIKHTVDLHQGRVIFRREVIAELVQAAEGAP